MAGKRQSKTSESVSGHIRFNALGLALFSAALIVATGLLTLTLLKHGTPASSETGSKSGASIVPNSSPAGSVAPWGELETVDVALEQPEEYLGFAIAARKQPQWVFTGLNREQTQSLMLSCGLDTNLVNRALCDAMATSSSTATVVHPDEQLLFALTPALRSKLYIALARIPANKDIQYPFCFPRKSFAQWFGDGSNDTRLLAIVRKLLYPRGDGLCFSDFDYLMQQTTSDAERMEIVKVLSRQTAVLARLRIRPDTDIDKLLGYWGRGIQVKDVHPLLDSVARLPDGGDVSLMYLLPKFARERLNTFPMPSKAGDPIMDCHWSTMNFFNDPPSNLFTNTSYTVSYITENCYQVAQPSLYGDIILILDEQDNAIHSAVYLAEDLVFTKNGNNMSQPWMLMHLGDLLARYTLDTPPRTLVLRSRNL